MALTGITWLTGEVIDETRLNYMVQNTDYVKSFFTTGTLWSQAQIDALGWIDVDPWATDQIIDSYRVNAMYGNQEILRSLVGSGFTVWVDTNRYDGDGWLDWSYDADGPEDGRHGTEFYLTVGGEKLGYSVFAPSYPTTSVNRSVTNIDISSFTDNELLTIGLWYGKQLTNTVKFVKYANMNYLSLWVTLGTEYYSLPLFDGMIPRYYWRDELRVVAHSNLNGW